MRNWLLGLAVIVALLLAGWVYSTSSRGLPVEAAVVRQDKIQEFIDERGKTRLPRVYSITMPYTARLQAIDVVEGELVYPTKIVAQVVPQDLELEVAAAQAAVDRIEKSIAENADSSVEGTGLKQSLSFVASMNSTVQAAEKRVESGEAKLKFAQSQLERLQKAQGAMTEQEMDRAKLAVVEARVDYQQDVLVLEAMRAMQAATALMPTTVQQYIARKDLSGAVLAKQKAEAEAKLKQVEKDQERGVMYSPVEGVVLERFVTDESQVAGGTTLLTIGRLEDLEVEADILSQEVVNVQEEDNVEISGPAIGEPAAQGKVKRIFPAGFVKVSSLGVEQQRVKVVVRFAEKDLQRLRDQRRLGVDYRVRVRIFTAENPEALVVPRSALFRGAGGEWQVFVVRDGRARLQDIEIGLLNDEQVEIRSGVSLGELVVLAPETTLVDGAKVDPLVREPGAGTPAEPAAD